MVEAFAVIISTRSFGLATSLNYSPPVESYQQEQSELRASTASSLNQPTEHRTQPIHQHRRGQRERGMEGWRERERDGKRERWRGDRDKYRT